MTETIIITADTIIDGSGQNVTISGNHVVRVLFVNSGITLNLNELTIADGSGLYSGGGIFNGGALTVNNCTFSDNSASVTGDGGGIYNDYSGTLTVSNSTFSGNRANNRSGGGIYNRGTLTVRNSTFSGNSAGAGGGGIGHFVYGSANREQ